MFHLLIDTSVWLDLADKPLQTPLMGALDGMLSYGAFNLIVPRIVLDEFKKNRNRIAERSAKGLTSQIAVVKDAVRRSEKNKRVRNMVVEYLSDVSHQTPQVASKATDVLDRIQFILGAFPVIETTDTAKIKAADRALARRGPCHHLNKNSMANALLIEMYFELVKAGKPGDRFAFVTHNKADFSSALGDDKLPHDDLAPGFSKIKSMYFTNLRACLNKIEPSFVRDILAQEAFEEEPRALSELLDAADAFTTEVWHNRHMNLQWELDHGKHKIVTQDEWDAGISKNKQFGQKHTVDHIWQGALKARATARRRLGEGGYGPYTDFEWGMVNGKLSALRWALGEDWDELYT